MLIHPYVADDPLVAHVQADGRPRARVYRPGEMVIILGRGSDPETELHVEACRRDRLPVYRRRGGGCAVLVDPGNLILVAAVPLPGLDRVREAMDACTAWALAQCARCGLAHVQRRDVSDLAVGDRKVGGASIHRTRGLVLYGTTLLVDPDLPACDRYLRHPPREPAYRGGRAHPDFMGALMSLPGWPRSTAGAGAGDPTEWLLAQLAEDLTPPVL